MTNTSVNFYDIFTKLEATGLRIAYLIGQSQVMLTFAYLIFIWGLFEVFFRVYEKRDFMPFVHYIAYFAIMMLIFLHLNTNKSVFDYIGFPANVADTFTTGILNVISSNQTVSAVNGALSKLDTQLVQNGPGNKMIPNKNTPQSYKDEYALINQNLQDIGSNCQLQDQMPIIDTSTKTSNDLSKIDTPEHTSYGGPPTSVSCQTAISNVRSEMTNYVNYWKNTPIGKEIYIPNGDFSSTLNGTNYGIALFLGGGNASNIALGSIVANSNTGGISKSNTGGLSFSVDYVFTYFMNSLGTILVETIRVGVVIMAPLMMYSMFMFNALFYSLILIMTPIVFVLAMQKPENIAMYVKWIFTVIWARSWEIVTFLLINIYNPININQGAGGVGVLGGGIVLNDMWNITIMTVVALSPGIMALVLLEGRAMITSAMVGIAGGLDIEHSAEKVSGILASGFQGLMSGKSHGGGSPTGGGTPTGGGVGKAMSGGPTSTGAGTGAGGGGAGAGKQ